MAKLWSKFSICGSIIGLAESFYVDWLITLRAYETTQESM